MAAQGVDGVEHDPVEVGFSPRVVGLSAWGDLEVLGAPGEGQYIGDALDGEVEVFADDLGRSVVGDPQVGSDFSKCFFRLHVLTTGR